MNSPACLMPKTSLLKLLFLKSAEASLILGRVGVEFFLTSQFSSWNFFAIFSLDLSIFLSSSLV